MFSNELLLDAGDFDVFGWSSRSSAETENDSDFFVCWMSVRGEAVILGGGGESTSRSDDDELERERLWLLDLDRDFVLVTLRFDGESHVINDLA